MVNMDLITVIFNQPTIQNTPLSSSPTCNCMHPGGPYTNNPSFFLFLKHPQFNISILNYHYPTKTTELLK